MSVRNIFAILFTAACVLTLTGAIGLPKTGQQLRKTTFSFYKGTVYVYEGMLPGHLCRKIKKGLFIRYAIRDSSKIQKRVQFFDVKYYTSVEGVYVDVLEIKNAQPDSTFSPLKLGRELIYAK